MLSYPPRLLLGSWHPDSAALCALMVLHSVHVLQVRGGAYVDSSDDFETRGRSGLGTAHAQLSEQALAGASCLNGRSRTPCKASLTWCAPRQSVHHLFHDATISGRLQTCMPQVKAEKIRASSGL